MLIDTSSDKDKSFKIIYLVPPCGALETLTLSSMISFIQFKNEVCDVMAIPQNEAKEL